MSSKMKKVAADKVSDFGGRLKEAFNNISNQAIADKLCVGKSTLTAYVQGRIPPPDKLIEIAKLTKCNLNWLLTGEGSLLFTNQIKRPQGIIIQGSKGGIGASTTAAFIAATLALKGYGVLLADDILGTCSQIFYPRKSGIDPVNFFNTNKKFLAVSELLPRLSVDDYQSDYYLPTRNKNLDLFFPRHWAANVPAKENLQYFRFNHAELAKRYQFVIFDTQINENPFYYSRNTLTGMGNTEMLLVNFLLEPILRTSKIIIPYDVIQSDIGNVKRTMEYIEKHRKIYPEADFAGIFLNEQMHIRKAENKLYELKLQKIENNFGSEIYKTKINFHSQFRGFTEDIEKIVFSRKTSIHLNFSELVDELLERIGHQS